VLIIPEGIGTVVNGAVAVRYWETPVAEPQDVPTAVNIGRVICLIRLLPRPRDYGARGSV
jgi:hypothetical protein